MLFPGILRYSLIKFINIKSQVALFVTLHKSDSELGNWKFSRFKFFWLAFIITFVYTWIPEYFFPVLQAVSAICLVSGGNRALNFLASSNVDGGVGLGSLTFDWYYITSMPLTTPFKYMMNYLAGNIIYAWILVPIFFYSNTFQTPFKSKETYSDGTKIPILNSVDLFNRNGSMIFAKDLYNKTSFDIDKDKFNAQKPIYITEFFAGIN